MRYWRFLVAELAFITLLLQGCGRKDQPHQPPAEVRFGYLANVTQSQAVLGVYSGDLSAAVKPSVLSPKLFKAGPSMIEALLAGQIDIGYVGPGPVLNAHLRTRGQGIRVLAGAAANGVVIVARDGSHIHTMNDLKGKRIATPQHGNTQDIAARHYVTAVLGEADSHDVLPIPNAEQAGMMSRGQIDAAWVPEPWGARLIAEAHAHAIAQEKDLWPGHAFALTLVVTTPQFLQDHPEVVRRVLDVHETWTRRLQRDPMKYVPSLEAALRSATGRALPAGVLAQSIGHVRFLDDPLPDTLRTMSDWAYELEFAPRPVNLANLIDMRILRSVKGANDSIAQTSEEP